MRTRFLKVFVVLIFAQSTFIVLSATELHDAIKNGEIERVRRLVEQRQIDVNAFDESGEAALHCAMGKDVAIVEELLKHPRINVNCEIAAVGGEYAPWTALHLAAFLGKLSIIKALFERKDLEVIDTVLKTPGSGVDGLSALGLAIYAGTEQAFEVVRMLAPRCSPKNLEDTLKNAIVHVKSASTRCKICKIIGDEIEKKKQEEAIEREEKERERYVMENCGMFRVNMNMGNRYRELRASRMLFDLWRK